MVDDIKEQMHPQLFASNIMNYNPAGSFQIQIIGFFVDFGSSIQGRPIELISVWGPRNLILRRLNGSNRPYGTQRGSPAPSVPSPIGTRSKVGTYQLPSDDCDAGDQPTTTRGGSVLVSGQTGLHVRLYSVLSVFFFFSFFGSFYDERSNFELPKYIYIYFMQGAFF